MGRLIAACLLGALIASASPAAAATVEGGFDLAEYHFDGDEGIFLDGSFSVGGEEDSVVAKLAVGGSVGRQIDEVDGQLLYARSIGGGFMVLAGARHEFRPHPHYSYAVLGVEGEAAPGLAVESYLFLSEKGDLTGEVKAIYDLSLSKTWTLQPRAAVNWAAQTVVAQGLAAGPTDVELGLRLRYELAEAFAPYVGVSHERLLDDTADVARLAGDRIEATHFVVGFSSSF